MGHSPDRLALYDATHKKKDGTYVDETSDEFMEKALALQNERSEASKANMKEINEQIFEEIVREEHNGRVRGLRSWLNSCLRNSLDNWNASMQNLEFPKENLRRLALHLPVFLRQRLKLGNGVYYAYGVYYAFNVKETLSWRLTKSGFQFY